MKKLFLKSTLLLSLIIGFSACSEEQNGTYIEDTARVTCHNNLEINIVGRSQYGNGVLYNLDSNTAKITECKADVIYNEITFTTECFKGLRILSYRGSKYSNGFIYDRSEDGQVIKCNSKYVRKYKVN